MSEIKPNEIKEPEVDIEAKSMPGNALGVGADIDSLPQDLVKRFEAAMKTDSKYDSDEESADIEDDIEFSNELKKAIGSLLKSVKKYEVYNTNLSNYIRTTANTNIRSKQISHDLFTHYDYVLKKIYQIFSNSLLIKGIYFTVDIDSAKKEYSFKEYKEIIELYYSMATKLYVKLTRICKIAAKEGEFIILSEVNDLAYVMGHLLEVMDDMLLIDYDMSADKIKEALCDKSANL